MDQNTEVWLNDNEAKWTQELKKTSGTIRVFSPYLTSGTADGLLSNVEGNRCEVYTTFRSENFASGASSIHTLEKLIDMGVALYSVPVLHAKMIIMGDSYISVGSQNLTKQGTKNREVTMSSKESELIQSAEQQLGEWLALRSEITRKMIEIMKESLPPISKQFDDARKLSDELDAKIKQVDSDIDRKIIQLRSYLSNVDEATQPIFGEICTLTTGQWGDTQTFSFKPFESKVDLTMWNIGGVEAELVKAYRYGCIKEDTGEFGWARVVKTRITFVCQSLMDEEYSLIGLQMGLKLGLIKSINERGKLDRFQCSLEIISEPDSVPDGSNLIFRIKPTGMKSSFDTHVWLGLEDLHINGFQYPENDITQVDLRRRSFMRMIENNKSEIERVFLNQTLAPFKYNSNLTGVEANKFFGPVGSQFQLRLVKIGRFPVLVVTSI